MIRFENITKSYGDNRVIADLNFEIAKGGLVPVAAVKRLPSR